MTWIDWIAPTVSLVGAGLAYVGARAGVRQQARSQARSEWGRRFTAAMEAFVGDSPRRRRIGRALIVELMRSGMASTDEIALAKSALASGSDNED